MARQTATPPKTPTPEKPAPVVDGDFLIRTPVVDFTGERFGVWIKNGVGETRSLATARECQRIGYTVIDRATGRSLE